MRRGAELFRRPPGRQEEANMADVLEQVERSGCIYFAKTLSKTAIQSCKTEKQAVLSLPTQFVHENAEKIEQWVILRAHSSCGTSGRPWVVRLSVSGAEKAREKIVMCGGLYAFVTDHQLREGDSLIFVLQEDARSEFEVYIIRGYRSRRIPRFPKRRDRTSPDDENSPHHSSFPSPLHPEDVHKKAFTSDTGKRKTTPSQNAYDRQNHRDVIPSFRKRLSASNIGRYDRDTSSNSAQFEFPRRFMRTYGRKVQASVKLQGIHERSPTHIIFCRRRLGNNLRVDFAVTGWSKFVRENRLRKGHELHFSLMADSYFVVRKVS